MRRSKRVVLVVAALAASAAAAVGLTALSTGSEGPLATLFSRAGTTVGRVEQRIAARVRGQERASRLRSLAPYRADAARLRRPDSLLFGAYDGDIPRTLEGIERLEQALDLPLAVVQLYTAWGDKPEQQFPTREATAVRDLGSIPMITWEPWLVDFQSGLHPSLPLREARDRNGLAAIARGDYDFYLDRWGAEAKRFGHPVLVRFAHEMNDPYRYPWGPQNNPTNAYIAAWRHVVQRVRAAGAANIVWVWSPHVAYAGWDRYWPGAETVDWVATGVLNYGTVASWSRWWTFDDIFGKHYPRLASYGKPLMIAEFGSLAVGGDRGAWYRDALGDLRTKYPAVRALLFFNVRADQTVTYQRLDWSLERDSSVTSAIRAALGGPTRTAGR